MEQPAQPSDPSTSAEQPKPDEQKPISIDQKFELVSMFARDMIAKHELEKPPQMRRALTGARAREVLTAARADLSAALNELQVAWDIVFKIRDELQKAAFMMQAQQRAQAQPQSPPLIALPGDPAFRAALQVGRPK